MSTNDVVHAESPVSWNTRYITPEGFECQLTLRGETGQEVLEKANTAMGYLLNIGCLPIAGYKSFNHNQQSSQANPDHANGNGSANDNGHDRSWCPIHQCEMRRWEKDGRVWFSHKAGDQWCTGKSRNK